MWHRWFSHWIRLFPIWMNWHEIVTTNEYHETTIIQEPCLVFKCSRSQMATNQILMNQLVLCHHSKITIKDLITFWVFPVFLTFEIPNNANTLKTFVISNTWIRNGYHKEITFVLNELLKKNHSGDKILNHQSFLFNSRCPSTHNVAVSEKKSAHPTRLIRRIRCWR